MSDEFRTLQEKLIQSQSIVVLTGAGVSQESGIRTFRGEDGLWNDYRPEELANYESFIKDPTTVWEWYEWRKKIIIDSRPNHCHYGLSTIESKKQLSIVSQNVDGLHDEAGSKNLIELHGNIWETLCIQCKNIHKHKSLHKKIPPYCSLCNGLLRPNVVWFDEIIPMPKIESISQKINNCDLFLILGTSGLVQPASWFGMYAKQRDKYVIEINIDITPNNQFYDLHIQDKVGEVFSRLNYDF
jgi:NAD-dependent deacetylase